MAKSDNLRISRYINLTIKGDKDEWNNYSKETFKLCIPSALIWRITHEAKTVHSFVKFQNFNEEKYIKI